MSHLGAKLSALVDGQLSPAEAERVLAHVSVCQDCYRELAAARMARQRLTGAADVTPPADLTSRLVSLACPPQPAAPPPAESWPASVGELCSVVGPRNRAVRIAAGSVASLGAIAAVLFVLGEEPSVVPTASPAEALTVLGRAPVSATWTGPDDATAVSWVDLHRAAGTDDTTAAVMAWLRAGGWSCPDELPQGYEVTAVRLLDDGDVLEIDVADGESTVVLTEQRGRLDLGGLAVVGSATIGEHTVHVLSTEPWHAVWQSGDAVVKVLAPTASQGGELVAAFPVLDAEDGLASRIGRGWAAVAGILGE